MILKTFKTIGTVYVISFGSLIACRLRWKYLVSRFFGDGSAARKLLPVIKVKASLVAQENDQKKSKKKPTLVFLHGMWHDASFYGELQEILSNNKTVGGGGGYTSYAIDLLPGERFVPGGSQQGVVRDLEYTLQEVVKEGPYILIGHSQGGLVVQAALQRSEFIRKMTKGVVLMGSIPLGYSPPVSDVKKQEKTVFSDIWGFLWVCLFGKLRNAEYAKQIFLLPQTDETTPEMSSYIEKLLEAPSDGYIVGTHPSSGTPKPMNDIPALILGARHDIIYPPHLMAKEFDKRFPLASHKVVDNQAHCFRDEGWQEALVEPLLEWMNNSLQVSDEK